MLLHRTTDNKGFSLIEMMIAVAIIGIALVPMYGSLAVSFQARTASEERTVLMNSARAKMEEILAMDFNLVDATLSDSVIVLGQTVTREVIVDPYDGNGNGIVDPILDPVDNDIKKITVRMNGVQLETLKFNQN